MSTQVLDMWVVIHGLVKHGLVCTCIKVGQQASSREGQYGEDALLLGKERITCIVADLPHIIDERRGKIRICVDKAVVSRLHRNGACPCMEWVCDR